MSPQLRVVFAMMASLLAVATVPAGASETTSELLERGIYHEQTVGDLGRAIEIYGEIVDDATAQRARVAEALYRIGMCHLKNDDAAAAAEAFERIIAEYPDQEQFVALARQNMPDDPENLEFLPAPWLDGEVQRLSLKLASGIEIGTMLMTVDPTEVDGVEAWRFRVRRRVYSDADNQAISEVVARRDDLTPIASTFKHAVLGHFEASYDAGRIRITTVGPDTTREEKLDGRVFDNEEAFHLFRLLPLGLDYKAKAKFILSMAGSVTPVEVEVTDVETVTVPAGEFECYRMSFGAIRQTFWYSTDPSHYLVKFDASGIVGELQEVYWRDAERDIVYSDAEAGFSVAMPPGWLYAPFDDGTPTVVILDPEADTRSAIRLHGYGGSCRFQGAGDRMLGEFERLFAGFTLRPDSWYEREIDGRPAVSFIGDYREGERDIAVYWTYIDSGDYCVEFDFKVPAGRLEDLREALDAIVASYDGPRAPEVPVTASPAAETVREVITDFHAAAYDADLDRYVEHLSSDLTFLGTDRRERFDLEGFKAVAGRYFSSGVGRVAGPGEQNVFVSEDGTMAWFDRRLESADLGEMRATGVLRLEDGRWRIVQYDLAFPVPNTLVPDLVERIAEVDPTVGDLPAKFSDAPPLDPADPAHDVKAALRDFHLAASEPDPDRYFAHLARDGVYLGTDRSERFTLTTLREFVEPYLSASTGWTSVPFEQHVSFSPDRQIAWFDERLGRENVGELRGTGVLRKDDGVWKIVYFNHTLPVPNELTEELAGKIRGFYGPGLRQ